MNKDCYSIETNSMEQTMDFARKLAAHAEPGGLYLLSGNLGTGKTVFAKGFAEGLGIDECVNSPTFTIMQTYDGGRLPFYHFDVYRVSDPDELFNIGIDEYFFGEGVCIVEWADLILDILPESTKYIYLAYGENEGERVYKCTF